MTLWILKNIIISEKNVYLMKNNTFNNVLCNIIFLYNRFLPIIWKWLDFHKSWLFSMKIFSTTLLFPILKIKTWIFKSRCFLKKIFFTITGTEYFTIKIKNSRVVENILLKKAMISRNPIIFKQLAKAIVRKHFITKKII